MRRRILGAAKRRTLFPGLPCSLVCTLRQHGLEPKRLRPVRHSPGSPVKLLLLEARKGGKPGLTFEPELLFYGPDGNPTADYLRIYHEGGD